MDYLDYRVKYSPIKLPNTKISIDEELVKTPIPTHNLDTKRGMKITEPVDTKNYSIYWSAPQWKHYDIKQAYKQFVTSWEGGGLSKTEGDKGGLTNNGITLNTWKSVGKDKNRDGIIDEKDLTLMSEQDHDDILQSRFWNVARADEINNPYLAAYVVDWMWGSGPKAFKKMHETFGLKPQSQMTQGLLDALNARPEESFAALKESRKQFYRNIVKNDPSQSKFLNGWLRRADAISLNGFTMNK